MAKKLAPTFAAAYAAVAGDLRSRIGDAQAAQAGPPASMNVVPASDADRARAWGTRHPEATDEAMLALAQQKYAEHLAAGMDEDRAERATAEDLTHFRYRARLPLYTHGMVGFKEQAKEAARLRRLAEQEGGTDGDA